LTFFICTWNSNLVLFRSY